MIEGRNLFLASGVAPKTKKPKMTKAVQKAVAKRVRPSRARADKAAKAPAAQKPSKASAAAVDRSMAGEKPSPRIPYSGVVAQIAGAIGVPSETVSSVLAAAKELVRVAVERGREVDLGRDFGKFAAITVSGRRMRVPSTGAMVDHPPRRKVRFRPARSFKTLPALEGVA